MTATLPVRSREYSGGISAAREKELIRAYKLVVYDHEHHLFLQPVDLRFYMGRSPSSSIVYACLWVYGNDLYLTGYGTAGGGGYHKTSVAFADALESCGIELSERIAGVGDEAIRAAIVAIGEALFPGYNATVVEAYA